MVALRKEANLQGINLDDIVWDCPSNCYDERFIEQAGADAEGQYVSLNQLPFNEKNSNKALANYIKFAGADNVDGFGAYTWLGGLLLRDSITAIVERDGVNGLTRAALLEQLKNTHAFDGDGMWGPTDIGNHVPTSCFMLTQVRGGEFAVYTRRSPGPSTARRAIASRSALISLALEQAEARRSSDVDAAVPVRGSARDLTAVSAVRPRRPSRRWRRGTRRPPPMDRRRCPGTRSGRRRRIRSS